MSLLRGTLIRFIPGFFLFLSALALQAQGGNAGTVRGTVTDHSGAVIPNATVRLSNEVSGLNRSVTTDGTGQFEFTNIPFNPYQVTVTAAGFAKLTQNLEIRSVVGTNLKLSLKVGEASATTVTVEAGGDLIENDPTSTPTWTGTCSISAVGEPVFIAEFAGYANYPGRGGRLEWSFSWPGRSCL